jgi:hypothetical protein
LLAKPVEWKKWQGVALTGKNGAVLNKKCLIVKEGSEEN